MDHYMTNLKALRVRRGLSQVQLGTRVGFTGAAISYLENGKRRGTIPTVYKIAAALDVPVEELTRQPERTLEYAAA